jgi:uncharacterized protein (UPF0332 family)
VSWVEMSRDALGAAQSLLQQGRFRSCASRAYFAAYSAVTVRLVERDVRFARGWHNPPHEQLQALVRNGLPMPQDARRQLNQALRRLRMARENADYRPGVPVDRREALTCVLDAVLVLRVMEVLDG